MYKHCFRILLAGVACLSFLTACSPTAPANTTTTGEKSNTAPTTTTTTSSTTLSTTSTTTTTKSQPLKTTTTQAKSLVGMSESPVSNTLKRQVQKVTSLTFPYASEDYAPLLRWLKKAFPAEECWGDFKIFKKENKNDATNEVIGFTVNFRRWINGCCSDIWYTLYFDTQEQCYEVEYYTTKYTKKSPPPRAATAAEVEQAKKIVASHVGKDRTILEYKVSDTFYCILDDVCFLKVSAIYAANQHFEDGKTWPHGPPCATMSLFFTIPR